MRATASSRPRVIPNWRRFEQPPPTLLQRHRVVCRSEGGLPEAFLGASPCGLAPSHPRAVRGTELGGWGRRWRSRRAPRSAVARTILGESPRSCCNSVPLQDRSFRHPCPRNSSMRAVDIIRKKRDGQSLSRSEIGAMVEGIATGEVADYQWSALLMAILWRGMDAAETAALTDCHDPFRDDRRPVGDPRPEGRQAQHRRGRRQDVADPGPDRRGGRRARADGLRPRAGAHRRHPRQARVDPRLPGRPGSVAIPARCSTRAGW